MWNILKDICSIANMNDPVRIFFINISESPGPNEMKQTLVPWKPTLKPGRLVDSTWTSNPVLNFGMQSCHLVGGFSPTHLKNISQIGSFPQIGMNIQKYVKPPLHPATQLLQLSVKVTSPWQASLPPSGSTARHGTQPFPFGLRVKRCCREVRWMEKNGVPGRGAAFWLEIYPGPWKLTFSPLKMDAWKMKFLLGRPTFRGYVSLREGNIHLYT